MICYCSSDKEKEIRTMKKLKINKTLIIILNLMVALLLTAACDSSTDPDKALFPMQTTTPPTLAPPAQVLPTPEVIPDPKDAPTQDNTPNTAPSDSPIIKFPGDHAYIDNIVYLDENIIYSTYTLDSNDVTRPRLFSFELNGTNLTELLGYTLPVAIPLGKSGNISINAMTVDNLGNIWVYERWYFGENAKGSTIRKLDSTGTELLSINTRYYNVDNMLSFIIDNDENIFLLFHTVNSTEFFVTNNKGTVVFQPNNFLTYNNLAQLPNGNVVYIHPLDYDKELGERRVVREIDINNKTYNDLFTLNDIIKYVVTGIGDYDLLIADPNDIINGIIIETGDADVLFKWSKIGVRNPSGIENLTLLPEGRLIFTYSKSIGGGNYTYELHVLTNFEF